MSLQKRVLKNQAFGISQEFNLIENHTINSRINSPLNSLHSQMYTLGNNDLFRYVRRKSAVDQAQMISNVRNKIEVVKRCAQKMKKITYMKELSLLSFHQKSLIDDKATDNYIDQNTTSRSTLSRILPSRNSIQIPQVGTEDRFRKLVFYLIETQVRQNQQIQTLKQKILSLFSHTFEPTSLWVVLWSFLMIVLILHNFFSMPLQDAFNQTFLNSECLYLQLVIQLEFVLMILDIFMQFNIAIMKSGDLIHDKRQIAKSYIKNGLVFDIVGLLGFFINRFDLMFISNCQSSYQDWFRIIVKYFFFFKQHRLKQLLSFFKHQLYISKKAKNYLLLVDLLLVVIIMAHYIACIWIIVGEFALESYPDSSWMTFKFRLNGIEIYLQAMYFACMTMTTVGYGDILPRNPYEYLACIAIMLISCGFFAYILNTITQILGDIKNRKKLYQQELEVITNYMDKKNIEINLQNRVKNYLKCMHKAGLNDDHQREQSVLNKLNITLQSQLLFQDKGKIFQNVQCIRENFTKDFTLRIIDRITEVRISPGETININELVENDHKLQGRFIFVVKGSLEFSFQKTKQNHPVQMTVFTLQEGEYYGLPFLFGQDQDQSHRFILKSTDFSVLYTLTSDDIVMSLDQKSQDKDKQRYCMIRDKVRMNKDFSYLQLKCQLCGQSDHEINKCTFFFMQPDRQAVITKEQYSRPQERQVHLRRDVRSQSRSQLLQVQLVAQQFIIKDDEDDELLSENENDELDESLNYVDNTQKARSELFNRNYNTISDQPIEENTLEEDEEEQSDEDSLLSWVAEDPNNNIATTNSVKGSLQKKQIQQQSTSQIQKQDILQMMKKKGSFKCPSKISPPKDPTPDMTLVKPKLLLKEVVKRISIFDPRVPQTQRKQTSPLLQNNLPQIQRKQTSPPTPSPPSGTPLRSSQMEQFQTRVDLRRRQTNKFQSQIMDYFETAFEFDIYFSHNNMKKVITKINRRRYCSSKKNNQSLKQITRRKMEKSSSNILNLIRRQIK